jgi:protein-tyrosine-phosphatase
MAERGLDISGHGSRPVDASAVAAADLILGLELGHVEALRAEFPGHAGRVYTLGEMAGPAYSVPDPYGGPRPEYERRVEEVEDLIDRGLPRIIALAQENLSRRSADSGGGPRSRPHDPKGER